MDLEKIIKPKITFLRDNSQESSKIRWLLDKNKIKYREVNSNSCLTPGLIAEDSTSSYLGYTNILNNIKYLKKNYSI